ncbi:uncharacterized protein LOC136073811 [Hydra vulgaris]|uniref:uncharacterized protein LOC136073811 n=1 Tax=Hydra vulgaris TaxID=6087 RepID=UPI0032E9FC2D
MICGNCALCGTTKTQFTKGKTRSEGAKKGGDLVESINKFTSNIKLPLQKFPGEMHIPAHRKKANDVKWTDELANELHKPVIKHFRKRKVFANGIDEIWAADLVDMQTFSKFNNGIKYLLMVIDIFSKYGWIIPLKSKTGVEVANAFNKIFKIRKCDKLWVDKGLEFYNKHVKALGVHLYSTENEEKSCVVERWNRTMKEKMFKYFSANSTRKYIDVLDEMVNQYNNTKHSSIKMTPAEASDKKNENKIWFNLNGKVKSNPIQPKFSIGDKVRIIKKKGAFEKGYTPRWTEEVFTVLQVQYTDPPTYKITDYNNEEIQESELISTRDIFLKICNDENVEILKLKADYIIEILEGIIDIINLGPTTCIHGSFINGWFSVGC